MGICCSKRNIKIQLPYFIDIERKPSQSNDKIEFSKPRSYSIELIQGIGELASSRIILRSSSKLGTNLLKHSPEASESFSSYLDISCKIQTKPRIRQLPSVPKLKLEKVKPTEPVIDDDIINRRKLAFSQQKKNRRLSIPKNNLDRTSVHSNKSRLEKSVTHFKILEVPDTSIQSIKEIETCSISNLEKTMNFSPSLPEINSKRSFSQNTQKGNQLLVSCVSSSPLPTSARNRNLLNLMKSSQVIPELRINSQPHSKDLLQTPKVPQLPLDVTMKSEASSEMNSNRNMQLLSPQSTVSISSFTVRNIAERRNSNGSTSTTLSPINEQQIEVKCGKRRNLLALKPISSERVSSRPVDSILSDSKFFKTDRQIIHTKFIKKSKAFDSYNSINQYKLKEELGKGAFGRVVKADTEDGSLYAVKIYSRRNLRSKWIYKGRTALDLVSSEIEIMSKLNHPHVIKLHEVIECPSSNKIYLVIDYASRGSLADIIPVSESQAKIYFKQLILGLSYLHKVAKVAHKDIKPDNLLIDSENHLRIGDFGSSQNLVEGMMEIRGSVSTYAFMAPELVRGDSNISGEAVDVWASGVTLYYMIVGQLPFHTKKLQQLYEAIKTQEVSFPDSISSECVSLLSGMLVKDPSARLRVEEIVRYSWMMS